MISYHLLMFTTYIWVRTLYRMQIFGKENVPKNGPSLIVANHFGKLWIDLSILPALWPRVRPIMVMYALPRQKGRVPKILSIGEKAFPTIVAGQRGGGGAVGATRKIIRALKNDESVLMMLAGEVSWHGRINPPRPAVAWTALRTAVPVLPVAIMGTYDIWPRWQAKPKPTGKITIRIGKSFKLVEQPKRKIHEEDIFLGGERIKEKIMSLMEY